LIRVDIHLLEKRLVGPSAEPMNINLINPYQPHQPFKTTT